MAGFVQNPLAWAGGRQLVELEKAKAQEHSSAALIGLALAVASVAALLGWRLWLQGDGRDFPGVLALVAALLAAALFRQLAHAGEAAASLVQRLAIEFTATLLLAPGAWLAATELPPALYKSRVEAHQKVAAARAAEAQAASARRLDQIDKLRAAYVARQRKVDELEPARLAWNRAMDSKRSTADRCDNELRALRQSMPEPPYNVQLSVIYVNLEGRAMECGQLTRAADQVASRYEQNFAPKLTAAKMAAEESQLQLEHAERSHAAASRSAREAERKAQRPCLPMLDCGLQRAIGSGAISSFEAWGAALALLFLGLLPALLLTLLPLDDVARERQFKAIEEAMFRKVLSDGGRKAMFPPK